jgi:hypothetical protein
MRRASTPGGHHDEALPHAEEILAAGFAAMVAAAYGTTDVATALDSLRAVRLLGTELEHGELALIGAARSAGATWAQVAAAMGARNRQTAQKRHADLARRCPRPPAVDIPAPEPLAGDTIVVSAEDTPKARRQALAKPSARRPGDQESSSRPGPARRSPAIPRITSDIIRESRYELVRAPDHAETRAWRVLVNGRAVGLVRPTWRGERSRPGWEPMTSAGAVLPVKGTGRITPPGTPGTVTPPPSACCVPYSISSRSARAR